MWSVFLQYALMRKRRCTSAAIAAMVILVEPVNGRNDDPLEARDSEGRSEHSGRHSQKSDLDYFCVVILSARWLLRIYTTTHLEHTTTRSKYSGRHSQKSAVQLFCTVILSARWLLRISTSTRSKLATAMADENILVEVFKIQLYRFVCSSFVSKLTSKILRQPTGSARQPRRRLIRKS